MSGIFDFLTSGTAPVSTTSGGTTSSLPQWYEDYQKNLLAAGLSTASEPFQIYQGPRVASFTDKQQQGLQEAQNLNNQWSPLSTLAPSATGQAISNASDPNAVNRYMSPYLDEVMNNIYTKGNENFNENILPGVMDTFTGAGQFGSKRNQDFVSHAIRDNQEAIGANVSNALNQGYSTALGGLNQANNTLLTGGNQAANLTLGGLSALNSAGTAEQNLTQKSLDLAKQDFDQQVQYPWQQLTNLKNIAPGSAPVSTTSVSNQSTSAGSPSGMAILGALASLFQ